MEGLRVVELFRTRNRLLYLQKLKNVEGSWQGLEARRKSDAIIAFFRVFKSVEEGGFFFYLGAQHRKYSKGERR